MWEKELTGEGFLDRGTGKVHIKKASPTRYAPKGARRLARRVREGGRERGGLRLGRVDGVCGRGGGGRAFPCSWKNETTIKKRGCDYWAPS